MPDSTSSTPAVSRTVRVTTSRRTKPDQSSPSSGPNDTRPREGISPTRPQALAGTRMEPPPSPAWPTGTMPDATAAPDPPLDPPDDRSVSHGLRVGPYTSGSAVGWRPSSGVLVLPTSTNPAAFNPAAMKLSLGATKPASFRNLPPAW